MRTSINHDEWTKLDVQAIGWAEPEVWVKDLDLTALGIMVDAEVNSPDGRSPSFLMCINGDMLVVTMPQGDTLEHIVGLEGQP